MTTIEAGATIPALYDEPDQSDKRKTNIFVTPQLQRAVDQAESTIKEWCWEDDIHGKRWVVSKSSIIEEGLRIVLEELDRKGRQSLLAQRILGSLRAERE